MIMWVNIVVIVMWVVVCIMHTIGTLHYRPKRCRRWALVVTLWISAVVIIVDQLEIIILLNLRCR